MTIKSKDTYGHEILTYDSVINKWGSIADIDTADTTAGPQVIWPVKSATQLYLFLDAAIALTIVSTDALDTPAVETLTLGAQMTDTEVVTIGSKVYTFQTTLTDVDGNVKIGGSASDSIDNLIAAINLTAGAGTTYAASMTENDAGVYAAIGAGDTMTLYVTTSTAIDTLDVAIAILTISGGLPADTQTVTIASKVYTFQTSLTDVDGNIKIGADESGTIDNLIAGINLGAGAGVTYAASMTANAAVTSAYQGAGDTMILHAATNIATTDTADNTSWGAANAVENTTWGAVAAVVGTGAHSVRVYYHDFNGYAAEIDLPLRGVDTVPISSKNSFGVFRIEVLLSGSGNKNAGQLKVMNSTNIYATVEIGECQTQIACQRVPDDCTGKVTYHEVSYGRIIPSTNTASMRFRIRRVDGTIVTKADPLISNIIPEHERKYNKGGIDVGAGEWIYWECILVSADNTPIHAEFDLELTRIPDYEQGQ